ncbi:helix-turn-helix transcriptional regulator [Cucumibacter marinus]|uniref:helix-turn-helix transcriptional regulator n=1 Tax=Cucumibacter marinus TaxID=1121252 RepID=UPI00040AE927|nr:helix-turn-helix transcriptional regulator [Cucumibacter marinus]
MDQQLFDRLLSRLESAEGTVALIAAFDSIIAGFGGIGFVATAYLANDSSRMLLYASQREPFARLDADSAWWADDPIMARLHQGVVRPFSHQEAWRNPLPSAQPRWAALSAAGLDRGVVFPTSRPPYVGAVLVFAGASDTDLDTLSVNTPLLHLLCTCFHAHIVDFAPETDMAGVIRNTLATPDTHGRKYKLSARERDCLRWLALGKSARDIADIEGLSVHTVRSYLRSAMAKLDASTQPQAIAQALKYKVIRI